LAFYFAWVDKDETTFGDEHIRNDSDVFSLNLIHAEGDFPSLEVDILNPRRGLLAPSRKRWAWLSYRKQDNTVVPLFFGRIVGVPQDVQDNIIRVTLLARPADFEEQKAALAEALKVAPYWDPVWFSEQDAISPDAVLEGYSSLWHIDRVTGEVTASDIIQGEDGQIDFAAAKVFYDSVSITYGEPPARKLTLEATVNWQQAGQGDIDITSLLLAKFKGETSNGVYSVSRAPRTSEGVINIIPGEEMIDAWPSFGDAIGGGWSVGASHARVVGEAPLPPILLPNREAMAAVEQWEDFPGSPTALRTLFDRSPGFVVEIENTTKPWLDAFGWAAHGDVNVLWVPIWQISVAMKLHWEAARDRSEVLSFSVVADVQELLTDSEDEEVVNLSVGPADVDDYIGDSRRDAYFRSDRGAQTLQNLLARARAHLLARARAVEVSFAVPFEEGLSLSCRHNATIVDPRIPGGVAAGKVKGYSLTCDGNTGAMLASITIGCTVGRDGTISVVPGTPTYVEAGYVAAGYQEEVDAIIVPLPGQLGYSLANYSPVGDGVSFFSVTRARHLLSLEVEGGLDKQREEAQNAGASDTPNTGTAVMDKINGYKTRVKLTLKPVTGGPFETPVTPVVTALKVPRTINMEAEGAAVYLAGTINADPTLSGFLAIEQSLGGTINADPALTGALAIGHLLGGTINADPTLTGEIAEAVEPLGGTINADPTITGALAIGHLLGGTINADPALTGALEVEQSLGGTINADPALTGALAIGHLLGGTINADPTLTGEMEEPGPSTNAWRYWRLVFADDTGGGGLDASECELMVGGVDQTGSGYATASTTFDSTLKPDNLFDNNTSTRWASGFESGQEIVQYDFGPGNDKAIDSVSWRVATLATRGPSAISVECSTDGITWEVAHTVGSLSWASNTEKKTWGFTAPTRTGVIDPLSGVPSTKKWRWWKVRVSDVGTLGTGVDTSEVELRVGGVDQTGSGTATATSSFDGTVLPPNAFDNNTSTRWASDFTDTWPQELFYDFGDGNDKAIDSITWRVATALNRGPRDFSIECSYDGGETWALAYSESGLTWASSTETKTRSFTTPTRGVSADVNATRLGGVINANPTLTGALDFVQTLEGTINANPTLTGSILDRAENYFARMTTQEGTDAKNLIRDLIDQIDTRVPALWAKADWFAFHGLNTEQAALLNLANRRGNATKVGSPVFTAELGIAGSGTAGNYYDTGIDPSAGGTRCTQKDASMFVWSRTDLSVGGGDSNDFGGGNAQIRRNGTTAGRSSGRANTSGSVAFSIASGAYPGMTGFVRTSSTLWEGYSQGEDSGGGTDASAIASGSIKIGAVSAAGSAGANQLAFTLFGGSLSASEVRELRRVLRDFLDAWDILHGNLTAPTAISDIITDLGTDLAEYWDADNLAGSTITSGELETWLGLKNATAATQATSANRPTPETGTFNGRDAVDFDGGDYLRALSGFPAAIPSGSAPSEMWALVSQDRAAGTTGTNNIMSYGDSGATGDYRAMQRVVSGGVNRARGVGGTGSADAVALDTVKDFSGIHVVRVQFTATQIITTVDDMNPVVTSNTLAGTATTALALGSSTTGGGPLAGKANKLLITGPLSSAVARGLRDYLMGYGGIGGKPEVPPSNALVLDGETLELDGETLVL